MPVKAKRKKGKAKPIKFTAGWDEREIEIYGPDNYVVKVGAKVKGLVAVHKALGDRRKGSTSVTALECGYALCHVGRETDAMLIAEILAGNGACRGLLEATSKTVAVTKAPGWAVKWLDRCNKAGRYVDPTI